MNANASAGCRGAGGHRTWLATRKHTPYSPLTSLGARDCSDHGGGETALSDPPPPLSEGGEVHPPPRGEVVLLEPRSPAMHII